MTTNRAAVSWLILTLLIGQWGCATAPKRLSEQDLAPLKTIGVASARLVPTPMLDVPAKGAGAGAGRGAMIGTAGMVEAGPRSGSPLALVAIALTPVAAAVGAVVGAAKAESAAKVEDSEATLRAALDGARLQETLKDRFLEAAQGRTRLSFIPLPPQPPTSRFEQGAHETLGGEGIAAILEIGVFVHLQALGSINPPFALIAVARTRLTRAADGSEIHVQTFRYESKKHKFTEWAAGDANLLRRELDTAATTLSKRIVDLFVYPSAR